MQIEELYKTLYSIYAPDLSQEELDEKLAYASTLEPNDFVNNFYQKYTGQGPTKENIDYMNTLMSQPDIAQEPKQEEISPWQSFKNNIYNTFQQVKDIGEFYTSEEGAGASFDIAATLLYEAAFGKEKIKEWQQTDFGKWFFSDLDGTPGYEGSDSEAFQDDIEAFKQEQKEVKRTMTFKEADSFVDYLSVAA